MGYVFLLNRGRILDVNDRRRSPIHVEGVSAGAALLRRNIQHRDLKDLIAASAHAQSRNNHASRLSAVVDLQPRGFYSGALRLTDFVELPCLYFTGPQLDLSELRNALASIFLYVTNATVQDSRLITDVARDKHWSQILTCDFSQSKPRPVKPG